MRALAVARIIGPILFTAAVIVQGMLQSGYSHIALPISALAAFQNGWVQNVNFIVLGVVMIAVAIGLHQGMRENRAAFVGPTLLVVSALGLVMAGAFPWRHEGVDFNVPPGHLVGAFMAFLGAASGLFILSRRMAVDPRWSDLAAYTPASAIAIAVLFFTIGGFERSASAPLHPWAGILQRAAVLLWFACTMVLGFRLLRLLNSRGESQRLRPNEEV